jgi:hypothetical protein
MGLWMMPPTVEIGCDDATCWVVAPAVTRADLIQHSNNAIAIDGWVHNA